MLRHAHILGGARRAQAFEVQLDRVRSVVIREFRGHVFNLSTPQGYFTISRGLYTGNTAWAFNAAHKDGIEDAREVLPDLRSRWVELCDDATGAPLDDRVCVDSIALHGQVDVDGVFFQPATAPHPDAEGRTQVPDALIGQTYDFPPNRPNDRSTLAPWRPGWGVPAWEWRGRRVHLS
jgi:hypothetical protein